MPDDHAAPAAGDAGGRALDRRTLLMGAAGTLAAAGLSGPAGAWAHGTSVASRAARRFDPALARQLQKTLRTALRDPSVHAPGAILHVRSPTLGHWSGAAGLGRVAPKVPMRAGDRFRAGSIMKPFVSVVVLQLVERGRLSLDARLPEVLPADVVGRFPTAPDVTIRMLLSHRSGIPEWDLPEQDEYAARHPAHVWTIAEILDLAAAKPPVFAPGTAYSYSNTEYNLLGLVIDRATGGSWRHEITRRVVRPLRLTHTSLPAPGDLSIKGAHAHGYFELDGRTVDLTRLDPSIAGAAGGSGLVTTVQDLARFWDALLKGRLFRRRDTLKEMLTFGPTPGTVTSGYGLGVEQYALPGGVELIGHLGGAGTYRTFVGRQRPQDVTMAFAMNFQDDPSPLIFPVVKVLAAT
ncbi:MAG TPA: serine hydrolase domain-containing protein [Baekduia sp.]|jgi:D-alanyl-D-alanine carboxypeptidase|nr:serine hydrolase domain-containing protein [Baekduia sp.]